MPPTVLILLAILALLLAVATPATGGKVPAWVAMIVIAIFCVIVASVHVLPLR